MDISDMFVTATKVKVKYLCPVLMRYKPITDKLD